MSVYVIETDRTRIRRLTPDDSDALFTLLSDPATMRYVDNNQPKTRAQSDAFLAVQLERYRTLGYGEFAVEERATGSFIGVAGLFPPTTQGADVELGYLFSRSVWGMGIGREVAAAVLAWGLERHAFTAVVATIDPENVASTRIALSLGFRFERFELDEYGLPTDVYVYHAGQSTRPGSK